MAKFIDPFDAPKSQAIADFVDPFDPQPAQPAKPKPATAAEHVSDVAHSVATGTLGLTGGMATLADLASGLNPVAAVQRAVGQKPTTLNDGVKRAQGIVSGLTGGTFEDGPGIGGAYSSAMESVQAGKSDELQAKQKDLAETEGFWASAGKVVSDPQLAGHFLAEQVPNLVTMGAGTAGTAARAAASAVGRGVAKPVAQEIGKKTAAKHIAATEGVMEAGPAAMGAQQDAMQAPLEQLAEVPAFLELVDAGLTVAEAREQMARNAGLWAAPIGFVAGLAGGKISAPLEAEIFTRNMDVSGLAGLLSAKGAAKVATGVVKESAEEIVQEGGAQIGQNVGAMQTVDPGRDLMEGVPEAAGTGAAVGGTLGGGLTAGGVLASRPAGPLERVAKQATGQPAQPLSAAAQAAQAAATQATDFNRPDASEPPPTDGGDVTATVREGSENELMRRVMAAKTPEERTAAQADLTEFRRAVAASKNPEAAVGAAEKLQQARKEREEEADGDLAGARKGDLVDAGGDTGAQQHGRTDDPGAGEAAAADLPAAGRAPADQRDAQVATSAATPPPQQDPAPAAPADAPAPESAAAAPSAADPAPADPQDPAAPAAPDAAAPAAEGEAAGASEPASELSGAVTSDDDSTAAAEPAPAESGSAVRPSVYTPSDLNDDEAAARQQWRELAAGVQDGDTFTEPASGAVYTAKVVQPGTDRRGKQHGKLVQLLDENGDTLYEVVKDGAEGRDFGSFGASATGANGEPWVRGGGAAAPALEDAAHAAATSDRNDRPEPTDAQKEAGNYAKGHARVQGHDVSIENPKGSRRKAEWEPLANHYGYIKGTVGKDKDHIDVFLADDADSAEAATRPVFVVDQRNSKGAFDEHKVIMGARTEEEAKALYLANYGKGWKGLGAITQMSPEQFKTWVYDKDATQKPAHRTQKAAPPPIAPAGDGALSAGASETVTLAEAQAAEAAGAPETRPEGWRTSLPKLREVAGILKIETRGADGKPLGGKALLAAIEAHDAGAIGVKQAGKVGGKLAAGEVVTTSSGRETTPFPRIDFGTERKSLATVKRGERWLMQNALEEARSRGDDFNARMFEANLEKPTQADKDSAEQYLFGEQPPVVPSALKPLAMPAVPPPLRGPLQALRNAHQATVAAEGDARAAAGDRELALLNAFNAAAQKAGLPPDQYDAALAYARGGEALAGNQRDSTSFAEAMAKIDPETIADNEEQAKAKLKAEREAKGAALPVLADAKAFRAWLAERGVDSAQLDDGVGTVDPKNDGTDRIVYDIGGRYVSWRFEDGQVFEAEPDAITLNAAGKKALRERMDARKAKADEGGKDAGTALAKVKRLADKGRTILRTNAIAALREAGATAKRAREIMAGIESTMTAPNGSEVPLRAGLVLATRVQAAIDALPKQQQPDPGTAEAVGRQLARDWERDRKKGASSSRKPSAEEQATIDADPIGAHMGAHPYETTREHALQVNRENYVVVTLAASAGVFSKGQRVIVERDWGGAQGYVVPMKPANSPVAGWTFVAVDEAYRAQGRTDIPPKPVIKSPKQLATEKKRLAAETERALFRELVANTGTEATVEQIAATIAERTKGPPATINQSGIPKLAKAIHKEIARTAAEREKDKHRDPQVYAAAVAEAAGDRANGLRTAFEQGFRHALRGKTKSTLSGDHLKDLLDGYEAAREWMKTDTGKAWYEGRPASKLENTGIDLRRHWELMKAEARAKQTDIERAWAAIEKATNRARIFAGFLPKGATPGHQLYIGELRDSTATFPEWLGKKFDWYGRFEHRGGFAANIKHVLNGARYPSSRYGAAKDLGLDETRWQEDEGYRIDQLQLLADQYLDEVRGMTEFLDEAQDLRAAATRFAAAYGKEDVEKYHQRLNEAGKKLSNSAITSPKKGGLDRFRIQSPWVEALLEKEHSTEILPDRAKPLTPPRLDRVTREGLPDHRKGENVSPEQAKALFGLADVGFGDWVPAKQDQDHLNYAHDALLDLANHFGAPPDALGFGRQLYLTIGALGHGKFAAHFQAAHPGPNGRVQVINLTNTKGDGTVYHEWVHALDHNLRGEWDRVRKFMVGVLEAGVLQVADVEQYAVSFLTGSRYWKGNKNGDRIESAIKAMHWMVGSRSGRVSAYKSNADKLGKDYWGNERELIARAAEAWAVDTLGATNTYLVNPAWAGDGAVTKEKGHRGTPYPTGHERQAFNTMFGALAKAITWTNGVPSVSWDAFEKALPKEWSAGEDRRKELLNADAMRAFWQEETERRERAAIGKAQEKSEAERRAREEADRAAAAALAELEAVQDPAPPSQTPGDLDETDYEAIFEQAAAELREESQEQPDAEPPGLLTIQRLAEQNAAHRLRLIAEKITTGGRSTPESAAVSDLRSAAEALAAGRSGVDVKGVLERASQRLMRQFPRIAEVVDEINELLHPAAEPAPAPAATPDAWTEADLEEMNHARQVTGAYGVAVAGDPPPGLLTIQQLGALGKTEHQGYGTFQTTGDGWKMDWTGGGSMRETSSGRKYTLVHATGSPPFKSDFRAAIAALDAKKQPGPPTKSARDYVGRRWVDENGDKRVVGSYMGGADIYVSTIGKPGQELMTPAQIEASIAAGKAAREGRAGTGAEHGTTQQAAGQLIGEAAKLGVKGADEALKGLAALFGSGPGRLNSFPSGFDEEAYKKARPHFKAALEAFQASGRTLLDLYKMLIQQFGDGIKEYLIRFSKDEQLTANLGQKQTASRQLASAVRARLERREAFDWRALFADADAAYGGTQSAGAYTVKDAYDGLEAGVNEYIKAQGAAFSPWASTEAARLTLARLEQLTALLPTQTKRTAEQDAFQQFSTVPAFAYVANWVAGVTQDDVVLEPSAGIGGLAVFAHVAGAKLILNELSSRRAALLQEVFPASKVWQENAEQLDNILPADQVPSVVVMNPPFSASAGRVDKKSTQIGAQHVEQAMNRLADGGRLVAIVGQGMALDAPTFRAWWKSMRAQYDVRAVVPVNGAGYAKYGTTFDNVLLVIDKVKPQENLQIITTRAEAYTDLLGLLSEIRNDRPAASIASDQRAGIERTAAESARQDAVPDGEGALESDVDRGNEPDAVGADAPARTGVGSGRGGRGGRGGSGRPGGAAKQPAGAGNRPGDDAGGSGDADAGGAAGPVAGESSGVEVRSELNASAELTDSVYEGYQPQRLQVPGAKPHPGPLVQSAAMASVIPPAPTYTPNLPKATIEKGLLSIAQIETVVYAGQAHAQMLPNGDRRGFFVGDGTGVGKGREISGILLDNVRQGRTRHVWVSEKQGLFEDAKRDFKGIGGDASLIKRPPAAGKPIEGDGILFTTYDTLKSGAQLGGKGGLYGFKKGAQVVYTNAAGQRRWGKLVSIVPGDPVMVRIKVGRDSDEAPFGLVERIGDDWEPQSTYLAAARAAREADGKKGDEGSRLQQLADWLGADFDGVIAFDEAHNAGNALEMKAEGGRGNTKPSAKALAVVELQKLLPKARIVYVSATGATQVSNLAFANRLGLWGAGTPFASAQEFIAEVTAGGLSAMELVARDLKQMGVYIARSLSYEGVTYARIEHELSPLQRDIYNRLAEAWRVVLKNMNAALELTGAKDESGKTKSGAQVAAMRSAFWGGQQRFFSQIITSMQMPSVLDSIQRDLDAGDAVVLQLVNTNEAQMERALAKRKDDDDSGEVEDLDMTPRDQLMDMVRKAFPTTQLEEYVDDNGNAQMRPVTDSQGRPVENKQAVAMREALLKDLENIRVPDGALEQILNTFGPEITAEVTGRKRRVVIKPDADGVPKSMIESRGASSNKADADAFMADKKRILMFSDAGGTGYSFHADLTKKNQRKRKHYLIQPGWRADKAVQGLGRSHRSAQASAPHYNLASTDIPAHARFLSSIARRLDQLGALTKGQRDTGSQGLFSEKDNLESVYATRAVVALMNDLQGGKLEFGEGDNAIPFQDFLQMMGLEDIIDPNTGKIGEKAYPDTRRFLNRMLTLNLETQVEVFNAFYARLDEAVELAAQRGELDTGMQTIRALETRVLQDEVVYTDPSTGAETRFVELELTLPTRFYEFPTKQIAGGTPEYVVNLQSGKVWAKIASGTTTLKSGQIVDRFRMMSTTGMRSMNAVEYKPESYKVVSAKEASELWAAEDAAKPTTYTRTEYMVTGAILPIWDRLKTEGTVQVVRTQTADGRRLLGRLVLPKDVAAVRKRLNVTSAAAKMTPAQIMARVLKGDVAELANGWKMERAMVSGELRIELKAGYVTGALQRELEGYGVIQERIQWADRNFIPTGAAGVPVLEKLLASKPVVDLVPEKGAANPDQPAFRRTDTGQFDGRALTAEQVQAHVDAITSAWTGFADAGMRVQVVATFDALPKPIQADATKQFGEHAAAEVRGVMHNGTIYVVAANARGARDVQETLFHEGYGHAGIRLLLGRDTFPVLAGIAQAAGGLDGILKFAADNGINLSAYVDGVMARDDLSREQKLAVLVDELLAHMAEKGNLTLRQRARALIGRIRDWLRANGFAELARFNDADLARLLQRSRRAVQAAPGAVRGVSVRAVPASEPLFKHTRGPDSPAFQAWFGDSKVLDNGAPRVVYHGTADEFAAFDKSRLAGSTGHMSSPLGFFFAEKRTVAEHYARNAADGVPADERIIEAYLAIRNPKAMTIDELLEIDDYDQARALREKLQRQGYDGIHMADKGHWIAFEPTQVKSTDNRGTFDPADERMAYRMPAVFQSGRAAAALDAMEAGMQPDPSLWERFKSKREDWRPSWLGALNMRHLGELAEGLLPQINTYGDRVHEMDADRNKLLHAMAPIADRWGAFIARNQTEAALLAGVMHDATLAGTDPSEPFMPGMLRKNHLGPDELLSPANVNRRIQILTGEIARLDPFGNKADLQREYALKQQIKHLREQLQQERERRQAYPQLVARWTDLSPDAKKLYLDVREAYKAMSQATLDALVARIAGLTIAGEKKKALTDKLRLTFEKSRMQGPYFPLARFGELWISGVDRDGERVFRMFEKHAEWRQAFATMRQQGFTELKAGRKLHNARLADGASGGFVRDVDQILTSAGVDDDVRDEVYQLYLRVLPDLSQRKHFIHRKGTAGYSEDALRAFGSNMFHGAHQAARLRHTQELANLMEAMKAGVDDIADPEAHQRAGALYNEMRLRHEWVLNPKDSPIVSKISALGFTYFLGATPAAAFTNLTQTWVLALPVLASAHGLGKSNAALMKATAQAGRHLLKGDLKAHLTPAEQRAYQNWVDKGLIDVTRAHMLAGISEQDATVFNRNTDRAMHAVSYLFHNAEVLNRQATALAAYRLAIAGGMTESEATEYAAKVTWESHFDYSNSNRARYMQPGAAKVLLMFRQYSLNMTWFLARNFHQAFRGESREAKIQAGRKLVGALGMTGLFAGALGMPTLGVIFGVLNAVHALMDDDDEPWDAEVEFQNWMAETLGPELAEVVTRGVGNGVFNIDLSSRTSLNHLWLREADRQLEGRDRYHWWLEQLAGPIGGLFANLLRGEELIRDGHIFRGIETMLPKALKDGLKAWRYGQEGVNTLRGDPIVEDVDLRHVLAQLAGFTPADVAQRYDANRAVKNYEQEVVRRRGALLDAFAMAHRLGDPDDHARALERIREWNRNHPEYPIDSKTLSRSLAARMRASLTAEDGITVNPRLNAAARAKGAFAE